MLLFYCYWEEDLKVCEKEGYFLTIFKKDFKMEELVNYVFPCKIVFEERFVFIGVVEERV